MGVMRDVWSLGGGGEAPNLTLVAVVHTANILRSTDCDLHVIQSLNSYNGVIPNGTVLTDATAKSWTALS